MKQIKIILLFSILGLISCKNEKKHSTTANTEEIDIQFIKQGEVYLKNEADTLKIIDAEFAENNNTRRIGLMNRSSLDENEGMLFIFDEDNSSSFWMKNTRIPLDILFFDKDSILINYHENARPYETKIQYGANANYRFVLEVNGGKAKTWGVEPSKTKISYSKN